MNTKDIIKAARERLRIEELTPMQHKMAGLGASESAVALIAPTGSGKTLAFALTMLSRINGGSGKVEALVISPTRELTLQIAKTLNAVAPALRVTALYGGHSVIDETRSLEAVTPDIIVGTPGRILDHINRGRLDLYRVKVLVADEYDKSLELGFQDEMRRIVRKIHAPKLIMLTSATRLDERLPDWLGIEKLTTIDFTANAAEQPKLNEFTVNSPDPDKLPTLTRLLCSLGLERTIVFVNHRESAERVFQHLRREGFPAILYHGALDQQDRETAVDLFTNGTTPIMVATDLAARGLDIPQVQNVIHYHPAPTPETRTHRNGRAARMGATGNVYYLECTVDNGQLTGDNGQLTGDNGQWTMDNGQCAMDNGQGTMDNGQCAMDNGQGTKDNAHCTLHSTLCTLPTAPCSLPVTLFFHSGRKEKLSKGDIVGALTGPGELAANQIGIIALHDHRALAAITADDAEAVVKKLNAARIKGRRIRVTIVRI